MSIWTRWLLAATCVGGCYQTPDNVPSDTDTADGTGATEVAAAGTSDGAAAEETEAEEVIAFFDDFEVDQGTWAFVDEARATQRAPSQWTYLDGDLVQRSGISGPDGADISAGTFAGGGDADWDVYEVTATFTVDDDAVVGVMCHVTDDERWLRLTVDVETGLVRLVESDADGPRVLAEAAADAGALASGVMHALALDCEDGYRGFVDGALVVQAAGPADAEGAVGLYVSGLGDGPVGLRFHDVRVVND